MSKSVEDIRNGKFIHFFIMSYNNTHIFIFSLSLSLCLHLTMLGHYLAIWIKDNTSIVELLSIALWNGATNYKNF